MSTIYLDVLDPKRKNVFKKLSVFGKDGVLAGGTALALQIKHRKSLDFDVFLPKPISRIFFKKVVKAFGENLKTRISTGDLLLIETPEQVEVHFVYVWRKSLFRPVETSSISVAAVGDIAADKAHIIGRRGQWRDYVDIFFLLKREILTLKEITELADKKHHPEFNPRLFLEQLTYYGDIYDFAITFLEESYTVDEIKDFLADKTKRLKF